jgi:hypothetical protein
VYANGPVDFASYNDKDIEPPATELYEANDKLDACELCAAIDTELLMLLNKLILISVEFFEQKFIAPVVDVLPFIANAGKLLVYVSLSLIAI